MEHVKILVVGPSMSGKTCVANFLCGVRETPLEPYRETVACRILETELQGLNFNKATAARGIAGTGSAKVEVWDLSGSQRYQSCWPAIMKDADGLILVFNPEVKTQDREVEQFYKTFSGPLKLKDSCCVIFAHKKTGAEGAAEQPKVTPPTPARFRLSPPSACVCVQPKMPRSLQKVKVVQTYIEPSQPCFKPEFERLVENIVMSKRHRRPPRRRRSQS